MKGHKFSACWPFSSNFLDTEFEYLRSRQLKLLYNCLEIDSRHKKDKEHN